MILYSFLGYYLSKPRLCKFQERIKKSNFLNRAENVNFVQVFWFKRLSFFVGREITRLGCVVEEAFPMEHFLLKLMCLNFFGAVEVEVHSFKM